MEDEVGYLLIAKFVYAQALSVVRKYQDWLADIEQPNVQTLSLLEQQLRGGRLSSANTSLLRDQPRDLAKPGIVAVVEKYERFLSKKLNHANRKLGLPDQV